MKTALSRHTTFGFALALSLLAFISFASFRSTTSLSKAANARAHHGQNIRCLLDVLSLVKDAETGQRGYLLTGNKEYLEPYFRALKEIPERLGYLKSNITGIEQLLVKELSDKIASKLYELADTIRARDAVGKNAAIQLVLTNQGKGTMDHIRRLGSELYSRENEAWLQRSQEADMQLQKSVAFILLGSLLAFACVLIAIGYLNRDMLRRQSKAELELKEVVDELEDKSMLLETVLEQMPAGIIVAEAPSGKLVLSNRQVFEVWRHPMHPSQDVESYSEWIGFHKDGRRYEGKDWPLARSLQKGEIVKGEDTDVERGDRTRGVIRLTSSPIRNKHGKIIAAVVICEDVTEQRQLEQDRIQALAGRKSALESARLKSEFLANMSHEIRTPLNGILGMTDLLLETELNEQQRKYAGIVRDSGNGLLTIINDILDFSKIEAGKMALETLDFSPVALLEGQADLLASRAREKGLSLMTFVDPRIPPRLLGDSGRIGQVLLNLVGNAIKFTNAGAIVARAVLEKSDGKTACIRFSVQDSGIGISEDTQRQLFQPFTQADGSTARKYGGTGLGLSICKRLVELMGGEIGVKSAPGQGAEFWFTCQFEVGSSEAQLPSTRAVDLSTLKVLIVDDDPPAGAIIQQYLSNWRMQATIESDPIRAFERCLEAAGKSQPYDVVIIDRRMPGMDGLELGKKLRKEPQTRDSKLILATAFDKTGLSKLSKDAGFNAFLTKPLKQSELFDAIASIVSEPSLAMKTEPLSQNVSTQRASANSVSQIRILVAEDNQVNQMLALAQLKALGYAAQAVSNGAEVLKALEQAPFDLILMDCQMPEMDGFEATRAIRAKESAANDGSHITIIALTANAMKDDEKQCRDSGMDDYLSKPIKKEVLAKALRRAFASRPPSKLRPAG